MVVEQDGTFTYALRLLNETREEVGRADLKAATLLSATGIAVTLLASIGGSHGLRWLAKSTWSGYVVLIAFAMISLGILFLGLAVFPRTRSKDHNHGLPFYFGDVARYESNESTKLTDDLERAADRMLDRTVAQLLVMSHIVVKKYRFIRCGMLAVLIGGLIMIIAIYPLWKPR